MDSNNITSVHFIGIGGVGMSGIARVAHDQGMTVTGSDMKESRYTRQLKEAGVKVAIGKHSASNIPGTGVDDGPDVVVVTTAVLDNNPELIAAKERGLTIWHRAQMLPFGRGSRHGGHRRHTWKDDDLLDGRERARQDGRRPDVPHRRHRAQLR